MKLKHRKYVHNMAIVTMALTMVVGPRLLSAAGPFEHLLASVDNGVETRYSDADLLANSQISYRAEGGFTGVQAYGVILSCVHGKISVLKTISDPRLPDQASTVHDVSSITQSEYFALWDNLDRQALFQTTDAPEPKMDIADEFTVTFHAKVGDAHHEFHVRGISRPEAARYYALRQLIDDAVHMKALWNVHSNVARLDQDSIPE